MPEEEQNNNENRSLFGPNGRWLWFAGGVLLVLIGVLITALFNLRKPPEARNDAIRWALYGMAIGVVINLVTIYTSGNIDILLNPFGATPSSHTGIF